MSRTLAEKLMAWATLAPLALALGATTVAPLATFVWRTLTSLDHAVGVFEDPDLITVIARTMSLAAGMTAFQFATAAVLAERLSRGRPAGNWVLVFSLPLFVGPAYCALIWKLLVDPMNGVSALVSGAGLGVFDWTSSGLGAVLVVALVQCWIWTFATAGALLVLTQPPITKLQRLIELDGGNPLQAWWAARWSSQRHWLSVIGAGLLVENLRFFEVTYVLTRGGPGTATTTVQWSIFEASFVTLDHVEASVLALILIGMFALAASVVGPLIRGRH